jgi:dTDP-4-amino-4,6-dideoxygalactose transaminase
MPVLLSSSISRQNVIDHLRWGGIQTTVHYPPVHRLTFYNDLYPDSHLPRTEDFARRELTLPLHPRMTSASVELVVDSLAAAVGAERPAEAIA